MIFKGSCTAMITPFTKDRSKIDFKNFKKQIDFQIKNKTDALLILGTTGEASTISKEEKIEIVKFVSNYLKGRIPLIVGVGNNSTEETIKNVMLFNKEKIDAYLIVTPYYNKCTQGGLIEHYTSIANQSALPIIMYNVPGRTGVNMSAKTVKTLSENSKIVGIKEASGNISQISEIISICPPNFSIYSGDDGITLPVLALGGKGIISVASNVVPFKIAQLCRNFFDGKIEQAKTIQFLINPLVNALFLEVNPIPVKKAMQLLKLDSGALRLPLIEITKTSLKELKNQMEKLGVVSNKK